MGMCLVLQSVADNNVEKILSEPELIWRLLSPDEPDFYENAIKEKYKVGFFSKLFGKKQQPIQFNQLNFAEGECFEDDLDKAWHGIHYCLNKTDYEAEPPLDFIVTGGEEAGNIDVGYGPARLFKHDSVYDIHQQLSKISEQDFSKNYDPRQMEKLDIYPNMWLRDNEEALEYILSYYETLQGFLDHCVEFKMGMAIYLC